jgi:hypothetical protein
LTCNLHATDSKQPTSQAPELKHSISATKSKQTSNATKPKEVILSALIFTGTDSYIIIPKSFKDYSTINKLIIPDKEWTSEYLNTFVTKLLKEITYNYVKDVVFFDVHGFDYTRIIQINKVMEKVIEFHPADKILNYIIGQIKKLLEINSKELINPKTIFNDPCCRNLFDDKKLAKMFQKLLFIQYSSLDELVGKVKTAIEDKTSQDNHIDGLISLITDQVIRFKIYNQKDKRNEYIRHYLLNNYSKEITKIQLKESFITNDEGFERFHHAVVSHVIHSEIVSQSEIDEFVKWIYYTKPYIGKEQPFEENILFADLVFHYNYHDIVKIYQKKHQDPTILIEEMNNIKNIFTEDNKDQYY